MGRGGDARVWVCGAALPAPAAAVCNGYQIHNSEFDCVHEAAVVHPMAVLLSAATAHAERARGVSGRDFLTAIALGVDVGVGLGLGSKAPLRFFRPATAGAFAATAAIGKLMGFDAKTLTHAFSIVYGQLCGTMQAHTEGSPLLAMQIGFNARNAVVACDMAGTVSWGRKTCWRARSASMSCSRATMTLRRCFAISARSGGSPRWRTSRFPAAAPPTACSMACSP